MEIEKKVSLVGMWFIECEQIGETWNVISKGQIISMVKDNYWYLVKKEQRNILLNLVQMTDFLFYDSDGDFREALRLLLRIHG